MADTCRAVALVCVLFSLTLVKADFSFLVNTGGPYAIGTLDSYWFKSAPTFFNLNNKTATTQNGELNTTVDYGSSGMDFFGPWQSNTWKYVIDDVKIEITIKSYQTELLPMLIFTQKYVTGVKGARAKSRNHTIGGFPSFHVEKNSNISLGYLSFGGYMFGDRSKELGIWDPDTAVIKDGITGSGPLVVFDKAGNTFLFAPFNNFMSSSVWYDSDKKTVSWGIMGGVDSVPAGYEQQTIMYFSSDGINAAFERWGYIMQKYYGKTDFYKERDLSLNYLGYWTDNGAYYYYHTEPNKNYEQTMIDVKNHLDTLRIPAKYIQLDSWWYPKDSLLAVVTWDAMPNIFPHGLKALQQSINLPFVAHNRYWSRNTTYAKQNGGNYNFIKEKMLSLPDDQNFWDFLLKTSSQWGLIVYEQDWLNVQFQGMDALQTDLDLGKRWLKQMGSAAQKNDMTIQYCMALSRQALQSLEIPVVTQARVTDDYHLYPENWKIGVSSLFAYAMGVAPSKDTFWTSKVEPGNPYNKTEPFPELQVVVSVLSTGPVGPGDGINDINKKMLMKCCRSDGLILKPSKPATAVDDQIREMAYRDETGVQGEVWATYSDVGDLRFGIIMTMNLSQPYQITPTKANLNRLGNKYPKLEIFSLTNPLNTFEFSDDQPFQLPKNNMSSNYYSLYYASPVIMTDNVKILMYGEHDKYVLMSPQRVFKVWLTDKLVAVTLRGVPGENITFSWSLNGTFQFKSQKADEKECATFLLYVGNGVKPDSIIPPSLDCKPPPTTTSTATVTSTHKPQSNTTQGSYMARKASILLIAALVIIGAFAERTITW